MNNNDNDNIINSNTNYFSNPDKSLPIKIYSTSFSHDIPDLNYGQDITTLNQDIVDLINPLLNKTTFLNKYNLSLPTLQNQYEQNLDKDTLKKLEKKYRFLSDYIDMVHDFRICFDYIKSIIPNDYTKELQQLVNEICSNTKNIIVKKV